jgi:hypothetical protein
MHSNIKCDKNLFSSSGVVSYGRTDMVRQTGAFLHAKELYNWNKCLHNDVLPTLLTEACISCSACCTTSYLSALIRVGLQRCKAELAIEW